MSSLSSSGSSSGDLHTFLTGLTLTRTYSPDQAQINKVTAHYMKLVASSPVGGDANVFCCQVEVFDTTQTDPAQQFSAVFSHVASPTDYNTLPIGPPATPEAWVQFRTDTIEFFFDTQALLDLAWTSIQTDVAQLIAAMKLAQAAAAANPQSVVFS